MEDESSDLNFKKVITNYSNENEIDDESDSELPWKKRFKVAPKRKLLVLCLGGLLVNRVYMRDRKRARELKPDLCTGNFAEKFLECIAGSEIEEAGSEMKERLAFVWGQEECIDSGIPCLRNKEKPLFLKDLSRVWEKKYLDLPWRKGQYSRSNTLLICVDPPTSLLNPTYTGIFPQPYKIHDVKDKFLGPNGEFRGYLEGLANVDNVPSYVKEHPFGQHAITPSHPDWNYYAKIVRKFGKEDDRKY